MSKAQWGHGFHTGQESVRRGENFPVGYFVHIFKEDSQDLEYQGKVIGKMGNLYSVQLFEFLLGNPTSIKNFRVAVMEQSTFYDNADDWRDAADSILEKMRRTRYAQIDALLRESKLK